LELLSFSKPHIRSRRTPAGFFISELLIWAFEKVGLHGFEHGSVRIFPIRLLSETI